MFVAGALIWANVVPSRSTINFRNSEDNFIFDFTRVDYGWPSIVIRETYSKNARLKRISQKDVADFNREYGDGKYGDRLRISS